MDEWSCSDVLILASASPRRQELLRALAAPFVVHACPYDEPICKPAGLPPRGWAEALAYFKARAVAELHPGRTVLGADTIVVCADEILGKPRDRDDARRMLELQAGRPSDVITGVCLVRKTEDDALGARWFGSAVTRVWMLDHAPERAAYLASGDWAGKAGAYGIQTVGDRLVSRIDGSFSNVVGLPLELIQTALERFRP